MKKRILILLCLAFTAVCMLGACGSKGDKNKDTHAFDSVKSEQVTEEEWKAALDALDTADNVSCLCWAKYGANEEELCNLGTIGTAMWIEKDNSKYYETSEYKFCRDEENKVWVRREKDWEDPDFEKGLYMIVVRTGLLHIWQGLHDAYGKFTYDNKQSAYAGSLWVKNNLWDTAVKFANGKVVGMRCTRKVDEMDEIYILSFYDYGKTTITLPTEWEERPREWWEGRTEYL